jgi:hypothetical protein
MTGPAPIPDQWAFPVMTTIASGVLVKVPEGEAAPPDTGPHGGVSVGASHLVGVGPVIHLAIHKGDGSSVLAILGAHAFAELGTLLNGCARRIMAGEFDASQVVQ